KNRFEIPAFGQLYLEIDDIAGRDLDTEGMIVVDIEPPALLRHRLKTIPNFEQLNVQTPFWVSFRDNQDNYMYVHSIEMLRSKVWGAVWPVNQIMATAVAPVRASW